MNELFEQIKNSPLVVLGSAVIVVLSAIITISKAIGLLHNYYRETLGRKPSGLKKLSRLVAGTSITYFRGVLGEPVFVNYLPVVDTIATESPHERWVASVMREAERFARPPEAIAGNPNTPKSTSEIRSQNAAPAEQAKSESHRTRQVEYIFVDESFFVQAITTSEGEVIAYSVTTRTRHFNPKLVLRSFGVTVQLGRTRFAQLNALRNPVRLISAVGARRFHYGEIYYLGNPGKYQTFVFSLNDAGYLSIPHTGIHFLMERPDFDDARLKAFRNDAVINTYTVTAPNVGVEDLGPIRFGANLDQVRTLTE